nr:pentapeptide repeat-containing protein [Trichocoleus sp. FACHB-262]
MGKGAINGVTGNWTGLAGDVLEAGVAVGLDDDPGQVAWLLIYRSLNKALASLITDNRSLLVKQPRNLDAICDRLEQSLASLELTIDTEFFRVPRQFLLLSQIIPPFEQWLREFVEPEQPAQAQAIAERLPTYFVYALNDEWRKRAKDYDCLKQLDTPFTKATEREQAWREYASWLQQQIEEPLLGVAAFGLQKVYVPLRAFYERDSENGEEIELGRGGKARGPKRIVVDLKSELDGWLQRGDKDDAVRVISGGPGSGKSSFTKVFAAELAQQPQFRVLYVPLHRIDPAKDLVAVLSEFTSDDKFLRFNPLDSNHREDRLLLIFDGLDELSMQGKVGAEVAQKFIQEVQRQVERLNYYDIRVQALISGRELVVQANVSEFRKERQVLHLLPYFITQKERQDYQDPEKQLTEDQRQVWWQKYGQVSGNLHSQLPEVLDRGKLQDLTAQPLLNYLVALSYEQGNVEFSDTTNLNVIYQDLLQQVYQRCWERYPHPSLKGVAKPNFVRALEEIALASWHGDGRTTTVFAIQVRFDKANLSSLLEAFQEGAKQGVTRLLTAFYFRQSGQQLTGEATFEFTHKSFGEYLTARRIVRAVKRIHDQLIKQQDDPDEGWDKRNALTHWAEVCGFTRMDQYLFDFVCDEIRLNYQEDAARVASWQLTLSKLISFMLKHGMPMEKLDPRPDFHEENRQAVNAEESLLAVLNACARCTEAISNITWGTSEMFGSWLARLQGQRTSLENVLALQCLGWLNLENCILSGRDLDGASLNWASLDGASLNRASLNRANLDGASLNRANLDGASLDGASLNRANLDGASLDGASLDGANLDGASLDGANLDGASLDGTSLNRVSLDRASLDEASLDGASLNWANLDGASLDGANLDGANLDGANLNAANLDGASLDGASLIKCNGLTLEQVKEAENWQAANYDAAFRQALGLAPEVDINEGNSS